VYLGTNHKWDGGMQRILPESTKLCKQRPQLRSTAFDKGTSHVKWCEGKYEVTEYVAEFYNTFSNIPFFALPPLAAYLSWDYSIAIDAGINVVWGLLVIVGAGSGYFHATLSLSGQLIDEWAIIWVFMTGFALWTPADLYPTTWSRFERWFTCILGLRPSTSDRRTAFKLTVFAAAVLLTGLSLLYPVANAFMLFSFIMPALAILKYEYRYHDIGACTDSRTQTVVRLAKTSLSWLIAAVVCWVNDRLFCQWWQSLPIPYPQLHAIWHVFILIAAYTMCIVASWAHAERMVPSSHPEIRYWPFPACGIPFVHIKAKP